MTTPLITIEYEDPIDGTVEARFAQECDALSFEEMLDAEGAWHRRSKCSAKPTKITIAPRDDDKTPALPEFNDHQNTKHADVLALYDRAIAARKAGA